MPNLSPEPQFPLAIFDGFDIRREHDVAKRGAVELFGDTNIGAFFRTNLDWPAAPRANEEWNVTRIRCRTNLLVDVDRRLQDAYTLWTHAACIRLTIAEEAVFKLPVAEMSRLDDLLPYCGLDVRSLQKVRAGITWMTAETDNLIAEINRCEPRFAPIAPMVWAHIAPMVWVHIDGFRRTKYSIDALPELPEGG